MVKSITENNISQFQIVQKKPRHHKASGQNKSIVILSIFHLIFSNLGKIVVIVLLESAVLLD